MGANLADCLSTLPPQDFVAKRTGVFGHLVEHDGSFAAISSPVHHRLLA